MSAPTPPRTYQGTDELRADRRFATELPVVVNTVLDDQGGWIVDLSWRGLRLRGIKAAPRARICIHYGGGHFVEGTVRWTKPNEIGVALDEPLRNGRLANIWKRFNDNVEAFGNYKAVPRPAFGRRTA